MNKTKFKYLLIKSLKFTITLLIVDFTLGFFAKQIYFNQKTGKHARITYSIKKTPSSKILIFGSSHANRHYIPSVFEKELGLSCYNAGVQGQKIIFHSTLQKIILKRAKPELIILNIDEDWLYKSDEAYDRLSDLFPYYWEYREIIKPSLSIQSKLIDFKLFFKSYQENSTIIHAIKYFLFPQKDFKGYRPLFGKLKRPNIISNNNNVVTTSNQTKTFDTNFITALNSFITNAKKYNIKLIFVKSPNLIKKDFSKNASLNKIKEIANRKDIPFFDYSNSEHFIFKYSLYYDGSHLNDDGAHLFSELLVELIKKSDNTQYEKMTRIQ